MAIVMAKENIVNYEKLSKKFITNTVMKFNELKLKHKNPKPTDKKFTFVVRHSPVPTIGTKFEMCFYFVHRINGLSAPIFERVCSECLFEGDIQDLYEVLTGQQEPAERMLETGGSKRRFVNTIANETIPERQFGEEEKEVERGSVIVDWVDHRRKAGRKTKITDRYGIATGSMYSAVMTYVEEGKWTVKEIKAKFPGHNINPYIVFQKVNLKTDYLIKYIEKEGRKIATVITKEDRL